MDSYYDTAIRVASIDTSGLLTASLSIPLPDSLSDSTRISDVVLNEAQPGTAPVESS